MAARRSTIAWQRAVIVLSGNLVGVVVVVCLYLARAICIPVALAIFLAFVLWWPVLALQERGLGRTGAVLTVVLLAGLLLGGISWVVGSEINSLLAEVPKYSENGETIMAAPLSEANLNDPVTRHLRRDFTQLFTGQTVGEALAAVRERPPEGRVIYFYVTDKEGRLQGVVPTRRLLLNSLDKPISKIMVRETITIPATATVLDACEFFIQHRLLAFPVVDDERRIVGLVDVDLYTEELRDLERTERVNELFQLIGVHVTEAEQAQPLLAFRHRFPWLLCNLAGGILAAFLAHLYRAELAWQDAVLALFIPVVLALSESVSIQSVTLTLDTLHGRLPTWTMLARKIARETRTGALLGIACGALVAALALIWLREPKVAMCLVVGIGGGVTVAAVIGMFLPNLLRLLRRNPQVAAGPIALAFADLITLLLYFRMAQWLLG